MFWRVSWREWLEVEGACLAASLTEGVLEAPQPGSATPSSSNSTSAACPRQLVEVRRYMSLIDGEIGSAPICGRTTNEATAGRPPQRLVLQAQYWPCVLGTLGVSDWPSWVQAGGLKSDVTGVTQRRRAPGGG
jgi:hypothetical protein